MKHETRRSLNAGFIHRCNFNPVKFHRCFSKQHSGTKTRRSFISDAIFISVDASTFPSKRAARFSFFIAENKMAIDHLLNENRITAVVPITFGLSNFYWASSILFFFFLIETNIEHVWSWISVENKFQTCRHICIEFNTKNFVPITTRLRLLLR